jgi:DNA adenine methylase
MNTTPHRRFHPVAGPLKSHGGKHYLAGRIVALMPRHLHSVEPYFGGGSVLLARAPEDPRLWLPPHKGVSDVVNDLYGQLMNFWRVLQDEETFRRFTRQVDAMTLSRPGWEAARDHTPTGDPVADAVPFFVRCRQSLAGWKTSFTPLTRSRTRRHMNGNASEWLSAVEGLADVRARLRRVVLENMPALDLIRREDTPGTLFYCDPTYPHGTRTARRTYGSFEMTDAQHRELLDLLRQVKGKVMLSGYPSALYDGALGGWTRHTFDIANHASGSKSKGRETEVLWCNF